MSRAMLTLLFMLATIVFLLTALILTSRPAESAAYISRETSCETQKSPETLSVRKSACVREGTCTKTSL